MSIAISHKTGQSHKNLIKSPYGRRDPGEGLPPPAPGAALRNESRISIIPNPPEPIGFADKDVITHRGREGLSATCVPERLIATGRLAGGCVELFN
jgi:hypothetical protein